MQGTGNRYPEALQTLIDNTEIDACRMIWQQILDGNTLYDFVLGIFSEADSVCAGPMYFEFDLEGLDSEYNDEYEGKTLYILLCVEGKPICIKAKVSDHRLTFVLNKLGMEKADWSFTQFIVVEEDVFESLYENGSLKNGSIVDAYGNPIEMPDPNK